MCTMHHVPVSSAQGLCDDLYVPPEFEPLPLSDLPSLAEKLADRYIYTPTTSSNGDTGSSSQSVGSGSETRFVTSHARRHIV